MFMLNYLKKKRKKLLEIKSSEDEVLENFSNITIDILNHNVLYKDEIEIIMQGAKTLLENKNVDSLEEGIIVFSTMFRGLKYKRTEKDDNGNIKIVLEDRSISNTLSMK